MFIAKDIDETTVFEAQTRKEIGVSACGTRHSKKMCRSPQSSI
jgi:hypothetical protein